MSSRVLLALALLSYATVWLHAQSGSESPTIHQLFLEDQRDQQIDNEALSAGEQAKLRARYDRREAQVIRLMQSGATDAIRGTHKARDLFETGVILTHSHVPENQLLAHVAFTAAAFGGITEAKHLAATSLDRYLLFSKQTPLFGTIFQVPYRGWHHDVSPDMNDSIRAAFCIPAKRQMDKMFDKEKRGVTLPEIGHDVFWDTTSHGCHTEKEAVE